MEEIKELNTRYIDPPIPGQKYGLLSFIPAKDVTPNEKGFYGYIKLRGNFSTLEEVATQEQDIIRNTDSTNSIHTCLVGHPVPLVTKGFAQEVNQVDIKDTIEKDVSHNVRKRAMEERKQMEEIKEREEELKKDVDEPDPEDAYNSKRTKLAVLRWTLKEHKKKVVEIQDLRDTCINELLEESKNHPDWEKNHLARYYAARRKANIPEDQELPDFMALIHKPIYDPEEE